MLYTDEGVSLDESGSRFALALLIAHERLKGSESFWAPWIESLPQHYDCLVAWKESELVALDTRSDIICRLHPSLTNPEAFVLDLTVTS